MNNMESYIFTDMRDIGPEFVDILTNPRIVSLIFFLYLTKYLQLYMYNLGIDWY